MRKTRYAAALTSLCLASTLCMSSAFARTDVSPVPDLPTVDCTPVFKLVTTAVSLLSVAGIASPTIDQIANTVANISGMPLSTVNQCLGK